MYSSARERPAEVVSVSVVCQGDESVGDTGADIHPHDDGYRLLDRQYYLKQTTQFVYFMRSMQVG